MMDLPDWLDEPMLMLSHFTPTIWRHESNRINGFRRPLPQGYLTHHTEAEPPPFAFFDNQSQ